MEPARGSITRRGGEDGDHSVLSILGGPLAGQYPTGRIGIKRERCSWRKDVQVLLTPNGLPGPPTRFNKLIECRVPRRILIRVRATLDRRARLSGIGDGLVAAIGNVVDAEFVVQTSPTAPTRPKRLAFVAIARTGGTKLYYAPQCG